MSYDVIHLPSKHYASRGDVAVKMLIMHCFGLTLEEMLKTLDALKISAHYLIPVMTGAELAASLPELLGLTDLNILRYPDQVPVLALVSPEHEAWHAGESSFGSFNTPGKTSLNDCSIGIEIESPNYGQNGDLRCFGTYTEGQKLTTLALTAYLTQRYKIPCSNIFAHSTIAPGRKTDPGAHFFWNALRESGFGYSYDFLNLEPLLREVGWPRVLDGALLPSSIPHKKMIRVQKKLRNAGFRGCPLTGALDRKTLDTIYAYQLQYFS